MKNHLAKNIAIGLVLLVVYVVAGKLGLKLAFVNASATAVWAPTGIALAALLLLGFRFWPVIFLGAFLVNLTTAGSALTSFSIELGNTFEATIGAYLVTRFAGGKQAFEQPRDIFKFAALAGIVSTAIAATIGTLTLALGNLADIGQIDKIWLTWWLGDMGGALLVAPFLIIWSSFTWPKKIRAGKFFEMILFLIMLILVYQIIFGKTPWAGRHYPLDFLLVPLMLWAALRFSRRQTVTAILIFAALAIWGTLQGFGPFTSGSFDTSLLLLQAFLVTVGMGTLTVSSLITRQQELQDNLISYNQQLDQEKIKDEALLASIGEGIVATDEAGKIILINKSFEDLLGWKEQQVLGKHTLDILKMQDEQGRNIPEKQRPLIQAFSSGKKIIVNYYLLRKDKTKFFATITTTPIVLGGKVIGVIKIFRDISKEKEIDKAKSEFVSLASHQLRTPLTVIKWHSSRLLDNWGKRKAFSSEARKKSIQEIYDTDQRMLDLVTAILNVSKIDLGTLAVEPENIRLENIAEDVLKELRLGIQGKELKVKKQFSPNLPRVLADPKLIRILFQNLLTNSIKYTPKGGQITCSIALKDKNFLISVVDTGIGIPAGNGKRVFEKFFRTDTARNIDPNGNGLGMYIVKAIVDVAGGKIWFESKENQGTTFYVIIPLSGMKEKTGVKGLAESYS